jgi:hypothetical protein
MGRLLQSPLDHLHLAPARWTMQVARADRRALPAASFTLLLDRLNH